MCSKGGLYDLKNNSILLRRHHSLNDLERIIKTDRVTSLVAGVDPACFEEDEREDSALPPRLYHSTTKISQLLKTESVNALLSARIPNWEKRVHRDAGILRNVLADFQARYGGKEPIEPPWLAGDVEPYEQYQEFHELVQPVKPPPELEVAEKETLEDASTSSDGPMRRLEKRIACGMPRDVAIQMFWLEQRNIDRGEDIDTDNSV